MASEEEYKIGYWTVEDQRKLGSALRVNFGTAETIRQRYWTATEKRIFSEAAASSTNGLVYLSDFGPVSEGIECVLQVLEGVKEETEIVFSID